MSAGSPGPVVSYGAGGTLLFQRARGGNRRQRSLAIRTPSRYNTFFGIHLHSFTQELIVFAIKAEVGDLRARTFVFTSQKTMYGGKSIARGDTIFVFASENEGGHGLIARGAVTSAEAIAKQSGVARQTPRVSIAVERTALATRTLGRSELKPFTDWNDGRPETELNFKFYRQATNKIIGISDEAAAFIGGFF
jgi:hypothetical protein